MKTFIISTALAVGLVAGAANAGNLSAPVMEKQVVVQDTRDNSDRDMQMVLAMVTLGMFITLGIAN